MFPHKKFILYDCCIYLLCAFTAFLLGYVGNYGEPFALALLFACGGAEIPLAPCIVGIFLFAVSFGDSALFYIYLAQTLLLALAIFLCRKYAQNKTLRAVIPFVSLCGTLCLFIFLGPFQEYSILPLFSWEITPLTQRIIIACIILLLAAMFTVALKALLFKFLKCRFQGEELIFSAILYGVVGIGFCRFFGFNAYMGAAFLLLLLFTQVTKDCLALAFSFLLALPAWWVGGAQIERFFLYALCVCFFIKFGRVSGVLALLSVFALYSFFDGAYAYPTDILISHILSAIIPCFLFLCLPTPFIRQLENELIFYREKHLSRIAINRNRLAIGEKLFEISSVFKEIQTTFSKLGTTQAETGAKEYMRGCVLEEVCKKCPHYGVCAKENIGDILQKLVEVGCLKGKITLMDSPAALCKLCNRQSDLLYAVNKQIGEYKQYMLEVENAASGRTLLSNQALGVSEILRNIALEQSKPLTIYSEKERAFSTALLKAGIVCSEVLIFGEDEQFTLSLVSFGKTDVKRIAAIASELFNLPLIISERIALSKDKFCCILRKKPAFDAAFGIASSTKQGEIAGGDTHSVILIDERTFMVALSDGMGSGEYAKQVSECTISLLESFYKAKMPSDVVLSTINKLLSFSREETFACVDIAIIHLDYAQADIVKIGSPMGFILSDTTLKILDNSSLPLGILECVHPQTSAYQLQENDVLLFLSDGITSAFHSSTDLCEALSVLARSNPQELADEILNRAIDEYGGISKDDMTVLAVRLFKSAT